MKNEEEDSKLTEKQKRFCDEYLLDLNATQAAIRAGYSEHTARQIGQENLTKPVIKAYISEKNRKIEEKLDINIEWVLNRLVENCDRSMQAIPVRDKEGNETGEYKYEGNVANRSLELIGKHLGMFKDKIEMTVSSRTDQELFDEANELLNIARKRQASINFDGTEEKTSSYEMEASTGSSDSSL